MRRFTRARHRMVRSVRRLLTVARVLALEVVTTIRVSATIVVVEVLVRTVPLPRIGRLLGCRIDLTPSADVDEPARRVEPDELAPSTVRRLRCTHRVADAWPFSHGPCLRRALVGGHLTRNLDPSIRLGVKGTGDEVAAHAWLELGGRPLEDVSDYARFERASRVEAS